MGVGGSEGECNDCDFFFFGGGNGVGLGCGVFGGGVVLG